LLACAPPQAAAKSIRLASTTSTENSGLLAHILPLFRADSGIEVHVVAVGTGQALRIARAGDVDVLLVHDRFSEDRFVAEGHGVERVDVMANDFVIVGPARDPAGVRGLRDGSEALGVIRAGAALFASRVDDSGTHKVELRLWQAAGIDPSPDSGSWYREVGRGMGGTLNAAVGMGAYTLTDRATWISFRNRGGFEVLVEGDEQLLNPYGAMLVNPARHPHIEVEAARRFLAWLVSPVGQRAIDSFRVDGKRLFAPAHPPDAEL
jgi:tungstate transport system substrate-binding protein